MKCDHIAHIDSLRVKWATVAIDVCNENTILERRWTTWASINCGCDRWSLLPGVYKFRSEQPITRLVFDLPTGMRQLDIGGKQRVILLGGGNGDSTLQPCLNPPEGKE
jgi:hypothetical protein